MDKNRLKQSKTEIDARKQLIKSFMSVLERVMETIGRQDIVDIISQVSVQYKHKLYKSSSNTWGTSGYLSGRNHDYDRTREACGIKMSAYNILNDSSYDKKANGIFIYALAWDKKSILDIRLFITTIIHELHHSCFRVIKDKTTGKVKNYANQTPSERALSNHNSTVFKADVKDLVNKFCISKEGKKWIDTKKSDNLSKDIIWLNSHASNSDKNNKIYEQYASTISSISATYDRTEKQYLVM